MEFIQNLTLFFFFSIFADIIKVSICYHGRWNKKLITLAKLPLILFCTVTKVSVISVGFLPLINVHPLKWNMDFA